MKHNVRHPDVLFLGRNALDYYSNQITMIITPFLLFPEQLKINRSFLAQHLDMF